jgi:hypothetical protein
VAEGIFGAGHDQRLAVLHALDFVLPDIFEN